MVITEIVVFRPGCDDQVVIMDPGVLGDDPKALFLKKSRFLGVWGVLRMLSQPVLFRRETRHRKDSDHKIYRIDQ